MTHAVHTSKPNTVSAIGRPKKRSQSSIEVQMNQRISASGKRIYPRHTWRQLARDPTVVAYLADLFENPRVREITVEPRRLTIRDSGADLEDVKRTIEATALRLHNAA